MPNYTPNYNLVKPLETEFYNVNDQNSNMDAIDTQIKANADGLQSLTTTVNNNANSINALDTRVTAVEQQELEIATTAEAQAGTDNTKVMTPKTVSDSINYSSLVRKRTYSGNTDFNTLNAPGSYSIAIDSTSTAPNFPNGAYGYGVLLVLKGLDDTLAVTQIYIPHTTSEMYLRNGYANASWTVWKRILNQDDYDVLFQSGSNGKAQVAAAITAKGVQTAADATFNTLANNISLITTGPQKANGIVTSTGPIGFTMQNGSIQNGLGLVTVSGLGFRPNKINIYLDPSDGNFYETSYNSQYSNAFNGARLSSYSGGSTTVITLNINTTIAPCYINNNGFALPVQFADRTFTWYAEG